MAFQSLYRRYRPQRFDELKGQDHVSVTLRNAVRDGRVAHAYLFTGPRGTGKTSTARILAKALNCTDPQEGEPCGVCSSCIDIVESRSLDVVELDAASNRGVEAMRDLVSRAALGTPGRWKVYIVDEVHMLTTEAANALLKTLEEPPSHVIFVLATTESHKVLPTIRSRTQHFEFRLFSIEVLTAQLRWVASDAGLDVPDEILGMVAHRGAGSMRDALSKLDQVAAAGGVDDIGPSTDELVEALCEKDAGRALTAVAERVAAGHDPRQLMSELLEHLRQAFLATVAKGLVGLPDADIARVQTQANRLGLAATVRAMEVLGETLVAVREAPDARVLVEVALVRLCRPEVDTSNAAVIERIERLERAASASAKGTPLGASPASPARPAPAGDSGSPQASTTPPTSDPDPATAPERSSPAAGARLALGGVRRSTPPEPSLPPVGAVPPPVPAPPQPEPAPEPSPAPPPPPPPPTVSPSPGDFPSRELLTMAWADSVLPNLTPRARARFRGGRFVEADVPDKAVFVLPTSIHRDRCMEVKLDVESALTAHFGLPVRLTLVDETQVVAEGVVQTGAEAVEEEESIDPRDLLDAPTAGVTSPIDHVMQVFDGATVVEE